MVHRISKTWDTYLKNDEGTCKLFWEIDIFTLKHTLSEATVRLLSEGTNLRQDYTDVINVLHHHLKAKINRNFIRSHNKNLPKYIRSLYTFNSIGALQFRTNPNQGTHFKKIQILTRLKVYLDELNSIYSAKNITNYLIQNFEDKQIVVTFTKYLIKSLLLVHKQDQRNLRDKFKRTLVKQVFDSDAEVYRGILQQEKVNIENKTLTFLASIFNEIKIDKDFDFTNFMSKMESGQITEQKDYAYLIYGFVFVDLFKYKDIDKLKDDFTQRLIELFFRILIYSMIVKDIHKSNFFEQKTSKSEAYKELIDYINKHLAENVRFLGDDTNPVYSNLKETLWYKLVIAFSKEMAYQANFDDFNFSAVGQLEKLFNTRTIKPQRFHDFEQLRKLLEAIQKDFDSLLLKIKAGELTISLGSFQQQNVLDHVYDSLSKPFYNSFIDFIDFNYFDKTDIKRFVRQTLNSLIPQKETYKVVTMISHFDLKGGYKRLSPNLVIYDSRKFDAGENNQLDFFNPSDFKGAHLTYADIRYASRLFMMASHTGWGQNINDNSKMVRHSCRLLFTTKAYGLDDAINQAKIEAGKVANTAVIPWTLYNKGSRSANYRLSNIYVAINEDYSDYYFTDTNETGVIDSGVLSLDSIPFENFKDVFQLLRRNNAINKSLLDSINYWHRSLWSKEYERKFFYLNKALSALVNKDPMSISNNIGTERMLSILVNAYNSDYWLNVLEKPILELDKYINEKKYMRKQYRKDFKHNTLYIDLLKNLRKLRRAQNFKEIHSNIDKVLIVYDREQFVESLRNKRNAINLELILCRLKRHLIIHHDTMNSYELHDLRFFTWKLNMLYMKLLIKVINAQRLIKVKTMDNLIDRVNV